MERSKCRAPAAMSSNGWNDERWDIPLERAVAGLRHRARRSRGQCAGQQPSLSRRGALRARRPGPDLRYAGAADLLALGRHADRRLCQRARRRSIICSMRFFPPPTRACCRLRRSAIADGQPFDFQIVHHNDGASRLLKLPSTELLWRRLSAGGQSALPAAGRSSGCLTSSGAAAATSSKSTATIAASNSALTAFGDILALTVSDVTALEAARSLVSAAVRQQPDADVGVRRRRPAISSVSTTRRCSIMATAARRFLRMKLRGDLAEGRMGHPQPGAAADRRCLSLQPQLAASQGRRQRNPGADLRAARRRSTAATAISSPSSISPNGARPRPASPTWPITTA